MPLDLLIPGLHAPPDAPEGLREARLPALEHWLARADVLRVETRGATHWLAAAHGLALPPPVAPVSLVGEGERVEGAWLRADPVHLRIAADSASLHPACALDIAPEEAAALVAALQAHFGGDGLEFRGPSPERWYVRVPRGELPVTASIDEALGTDARKLLPVSTGGINWASLLTEAQMLLASHDVNLAREREGRPAINSLWLWGGGELPQRVAGTYRAILADDVFARGLARLSGAALAPAPPSPDAVYAAHEALVVLDALAREIQRGDAERWSELARALDAAWFEPMPRLIERFRVVRLVVPGPGGTLLARFDRSARWRWFRRRVPLAAYA